MIIHAFYNASQVVTQWVMSGLDSANTWQRCHMHVPVWEGVFFLCSTDTDRQGGSIWHSLDVHGQPQQPYLCTGIIWPGEMPHNAKKEQYFPFCLKCVNILHTSTWITKREMLASQVPYFIALGKIDYRLCRVKADSVTVSCLQTYPNSLGTSLGAGCYLVDLKQIARKAFS